VLEALLALADGNGHVPGQVQEARDEVTQTIERLQGLVNEFEQLGIELKGIEEGLVDFRALREGREVYLCYRLGEETIAYWHELNAGFAGRQPL
jgi:hypothetical protein